MSNSNRMFDIRALGGFKSNDMGFEDFVKNVAKSGVSVGNAYMGKVTFAGGLPEAYTEGTMTVMILTDGLVKYIFNAPSVPYGQYECYSKDGGEPTGWSVGSGGVADLMVEISWFDLKALRDSGGLVPGMKYRITDYETMTAVRGGKIDGSYHSAGHRFDVIVTADTESSLNENASAIRHNYGYEDVRYVVGVCIQGYDGVYIWQRWPSEDYVDEESGETHYAWNWVGDASDLESVDLDSCSWNVDGDYYAYSTVEDLSVGSIFSDEDEGDKYLYEAAEIGTRNVPARDYFGESNLSAWKLKYCLDNDGERFDWARVFVHGDFIYTFNTMEGVKNRSSRTCEYMGRCTVEEMAKYFGILIEYRQTSSIQADTVVDCYHTNNPIDNTKDCQIILDPSFGESLDVYTVRNISDNQYVITTLGSCLENKGFVLESDEFEPNIEEGLGVIYELTDEFNNTVPYDFKNLIFGGVDRFYYTFDTYDSDDDTNIDFSLAGYVRNCRSISVGSNHSIYNVGFIYSDYDNERNYVNDCTFYPLINSIGYFAFYELAKYYEGGIYGWTFKHNNIAPNIIKHEVYRQAFSKNVEMQDLMRIEFFKSGQIPITAHAFSITLPNDGYRDSNKTVYIDASIEFSAEEPFTLELPSGSRFIGDLKCAEGKTYLVTFSEGVFYIGEIKVLK